MGKVSMSEVMNAATEVGRNWTGKQIAMFHFFNPNGLCSQKKVCDAKISAAVEAGKMNSGAIIAYGSFNSYGVDMLRDLIARKRVNSGMLNYSLGQIANAIKQADEALNEEAA